MSPWSSLCPSSQGSVASQSPRSPYHTSCALPAPFSDPFSKHPVGNPDPLLSFPPIHPQDPLHGLSLPWAISSPGFSLPQAGPLPWNGHRHLAPGTPQITKLPWHIPPIPVPHSAQKGSACRGLLPPGAAGPGHAQPVQDSAPYHPSGMLHGRPQGLLHLEPILESSDPQSQVGVQGPGLHPSHAKSTDPPLLRGSGPAEPSAQLWQLLPQTYLQAP